MTLTEQWKAGELESGYYFFKTKDNIKIGFLYEGFKYPYDGRYNTIDGVEEVLASVPTYEEQDNIIKCYLSAHERAKNLTQENEQLKGLLKECRDEIEYLRKHYKGKIDHFKNNTRLDKEISQVIGEDK